MRAAIEAFDAGADVAMISKLHPTRSPLRRGRGRHQRGARQRGRGQPRDPRVRHGQGLRLPRRPGRDRDLHARGARRHLSSSRTGARSSRAATTASSRSARSAPPARRAPSTPPTSPATCSSRCSTSRSASATSRSTRSSSRGSSSINDGRCQGVICWDLLNGGLKTVGGKTVVLATGGAGRQYRVDDERVRLHRRRHGDGAARRPAAEGHGVHAVPPDDALPDRASSSPRAAAARARSSSTRTASAS